MDSDGRTKALALGLSSESPPYFIPKSVTFFSENLNPHALL